MQWMPIRSFNEDEDDADVRNELELLDASIVEESQLSFRLPERSTTPEPLVVATEEKPHPPRVDNRERMLHNEIGEELSNTMTSPIRPKPRLASRDNKPLAWGRREHNGKARADGGTRSSVKDDDDDDDDDSRFHAEAEELMNPNFQSEYSEECIDSLQIYYGSKEAQDTSGPAPSIRDTFRLRGAGRPKTPLSTPEPRQPNPSAGTSTTDLQENEDVLELSTLSLDDAGSGTVAQRKLNDA